MCIYLQGKGIHAMIKCDFRPSNRQRSIQEALNRGTGAFDTDRRFNNTALSTYEVKTFFNRSDNERGGIKPTRTVDRFESYL